MRLSLVPSPVALAILSMLRRSRRAVPGRNALGIALSLAVIVAFESIPLRSPGSDPDPGPGPARGGDVPGAPVPDIAGVSPPASALTSASASLQPAPPARPTPPATPSTVQPDPLPDPLPGPPASATSAPVAATRDVGGRAPLPPGTTTPEVSVPLERHERALRENRELAEQIAALEAETTALESEMLALDLQLLTVDSAARAAGIDLESVGEERAASAPIELGNATLVPAPLVGVDEARDAGSVPASDTPVAAFEPPGPLAISADAYGATVEAIPSPERVAEDRDGAVGVDAWASAGAPIERIVVAEVPYGSEADDAGLLPNDILIAVDGQAVTTLDDVYAYGVGAPAPLHELELLRGDHRQWVVLAGSPAELSLVTRWVDQARLAPD